MPLQNETIGGGRMQGRECGVDFYTVVGYEHLDVNCERIDHKQQREDHKQYKVDSRYDKDTT